MQRNEVLELYQKETYNQHVATYTFSVEVAGVTTDERAELKAKKPGINLHFLRYGVFNSEPNSMLSKNIIVSTPDTIDIPEENLSQQGDEKIVRIDLENVDVTAKKYTPKKPNKKLPDLKNSYYGRTILNQGYLYVIEDGEEKHWLEYEIDEYGALRSVLWENNIDENNEYKDIRDKADNTLEYSLTFERCTVIWVGYSATQLSIAQLDEIKADANKKERLLKVECKGFDKTQAENLDYYQQVAPYNRFYTIFEPQQDIQSIQFTERLKIIAETEQAPDPDNENDLLEDMFITLLDPLGCADDLNILTEKENNCHEALIETLLIPQTPRNYYQSRWGEENEQIEKVPPETKEQVNYLFATALSTYKFVYDNPEAIDDYSRNSESWTHGVDKEKIYKILNVEGRKHQRERIYKMRDALGTFIKSDHYQNGLLDYKNNIPIRQETGKLHTITHLHTLALYEGMADRDLNLAKDYKPHDDYWLQQIRNTLVPKPTVFKITTDLLNLELDIAFLENEQGKPIKTHLKFGKKFVSLGKKIVGAYAAIGSLKQAEFEFVNKKIFYVTAISKQGKKGPFYKLKNKDFKSYLNSKELKELGNTRGSYRTKTYTYLKVHPDAVEKAKNIAKNSGFDKKTGKFKNAVVYVDKVDRAKYGKQAEDFLNSKGFGRFLLLYEVYGLIMASQKVYEKGADFNNISSAIGALVKTSAIILKLTEESKTAVKFDIIAKKHDLKIPRIINRSQGKFIAVTYKGAAKLGSHLGGFATVVMCAKDSYIAFAKADYDAAAAQLVAGVASGVLLASSMGLIAELAFPPALIISLIGLAAFGIAIYFTDTELEAYFKHYPLSTYSNIGRELYNLDSYNFMLELHEGKADLLWPNKDNFLVTENYDHLKDFKQVFVNLMNIIANGSLEIRGSEDSRSPHDPESYYGKPLQPYKNKEYHPWRSMGINISFGAFLRNVDDLEYEVYYVMPKSLFTSTYAIPVSNKHIKALPFIDKKTGIYSVQLWLQIPEKLTITEQVPTQSVLEIPRTKKQTITLNLQQGEIAVLCKLNNVHEQGLPLTKQYTQGYLYSIYPIQYRDAATGYVTQRSGFTQIVTKQQFLNAYPLKKITYE